MITIDQLLESVDLDFEPRWVTKCKYGEVCIWEFKPRAFTAVECCTWGSVTANCGVAGYEHLKLAEFENKDWQECIYEVPRKTAGKIENFTIFDFEKINKVVDKLNLLVDAVNELKGAKNE